MKRSVKIEEVKIIYIYKNYMVQLKVLKRYDDKVLGKRVKEGTVLEVTVERAKELLQAEKANG
jgi:hypothetical protein